MRGIKSEENLNRLRLLANNRLGKGNVSAKTCLSCNIFKQPSDFGIVKGSPGYLRSYCKECARKKSRDSYQKNKKKILAKQLAYRVANLQKVRARKRDSIKKDRLLNPEKWVYLRAVNNSRYRSKRNGFFSAADIKNIGVSQDWLCVYCKCEISSKFHIDHILPISLGGSNWPSNIQLTCPTCNLSKSNKHPDFFVAERLANA